MAEVVEVYENGVLIGSEPAPPLPAHAANRETLHRQAAAALESNATYLAITSPTAAQSAAQVKALTRQVQALIRLTLNQMDDTD